MPAGVTMTISLVAPPGATSVGTVTLTTTPQTVVTQRHQHIVLAEPRHHVHPQCDVARRRRRLEQQDGHAGRDSLTPSDAPSRDALHVRAQSLATLAVLSSSRRLGRDAQLAVLTAISSRRRPRIPGTGTRAESRSGTRPASPQNARIYQTDFRFAADGTSHTDDPGSSPRSNAPWVHPQMTRVSIRPGAEVSVPYSVDVPQAIRCAGRTGA